MAHLVGKTLEQLEDYYSLHTNYDEHGEIISTHVMHNITKQVSESVGAEASLCIVLVFRFRLNSFWIPKTPDILALVY